MNTKSPQSLLSALALSFFLGSALSGQFAEDFEGLNAGTTGMSIIGQGGWTTLAGGYDPLLIRPYSSLPSQLIHPVGGGMNLVGGATGYRAAFHSVPLSYGTWQIELDVYAAATFPGEVASAGLFLEPDNNSRGLRVTLSSTNFPFGGPRSSISIGVRTALGAFQDLSIPGATNLPSNRWYRTSVTIDFSSNRVLHCGITNLHTGIAVNHYPASWYLGGGATPAATLPIPNGISLRILGPGYNYHFGLDNLHLERAREWQVNQGDSTLRFDGMDGSPMDQATVTKCAGSSLGFEAVSSVNGGPWDLGISALSPVPLGAGGLMTSGGQIVNLDIADPAFTWLLGLSGSVPFASFTSSVPLTIPGRITAQMFVASPTRPEGYALSGASEVEIVASSATVHCQAGPTTDNGSVPLTIPPGWPAIRFCGQAWTSVFINANGTLSFGAPQTAPTPTVASFLSGPPSLALLWTDLNPSAGGAITSVLEFDGFSPSYQFKFFGLPAGVGGAPVQHSVSVEFSGDSSIGATPTTQSASLRFQVAPGHTLDSLIGISPGNGASPFPVQFDMTASGANPPTDAVLDFRQGAVPIGFGGITIPFADPTQWFVN